MLAAHLPRHCAHGMGLQLGREEECPAWPTMVRASHDCPVLEHTVRLQLRGLRELKKQVPELKNTKPLDSTGQGPEEDAAPRWVCGGTPGCR